MAQNELATLIQKIAESHSGMIEPNSRYYLEVDLGKAAEAGGYANLQDRWRGVQAVIPVKESMGAGMTVLIDGRTFIHYVQFDNGVVVPGHVAEAVSGIPCRPYQAHEDMKLIFS
ncbi:hypothetical protein [Desulfatirhabdium butyrativorans]|uniref:hypothetical protein n=1 Tax=Desulfatirhabdium butyrativorans TaxID=340467 RepID=UPI000417AE3A|nr:hypothetical protein [Desulfatirhabdium butyrativorans]